MDYIFNLAKVVADFASLFSKNATICKKCGNKFKYVFSPYDPSDYDKELCRDCNRAKQEGVETLAQKEWRERQNGKTVTASEALQDLMKTIVGTRAEEEREYERLHPVRVKDTSTGDEGKITSLPKGQPLLIDGNNTYCYDKANSFSCLNTLLAELDSRCVDYLIFFDANISHLVEESGHCSDIAYFEKLKSTIKNRIVVAPGGQRADDLILMLADRTGAHIVSNDRYRQYAHRYTWVESGERLHKFSVAARKLLVPDLDVCADIQDV